MRDPWYKRSSFWLWIYGGVGLALPWVWTGAAPTHEQVYTWLGGLLVVFGFTVRRPTRPA